MFDFKTYHKAESIEDAVGLLTENPDCRVISGGTDILIRIREGKSGYDKLVDIHHLDDLKKITQDPDGLITIGAGVTFSQLIDSELITDHTPILAQSAASVGGPQVRNAATIGGNICNGAPSADTAAPLLVLNARVRLQGPDGIRCLPLSGFYTGPGRVDLKPAEIMTGLTIAPDDYDDFSAHYIKYAMRNAMDIATIGCAASLQLADRKLSRVRLAYTVAGPTPLRCTKTEKQLQGMTVNEKMIEQLKRHVLDDLKPRDSWRAGKAFREHIIVTLAEKIFRNITGLSGE